MILRFALESRAVLRNDSFWQPGYLFGRSMVFCPLLTKGLAFSVRLDYCACFLYISQTTFVNNVKDYSLVISLSFCTSMLKRQTLHQECCVPSSGVWGRWFEFSYPAHYLFSQIRFKMFDSLKGEIITNPAI